MIDDATLERGLRARPPADPPYRSRITETSPSATRPRLTGARHAQPGRTRSMLTAIRLMALIVIVSLGTGALLLSTGGGPSPAGPSSEADDLLNGSLEARIAGEGAEEYGLYPSEVPLLYATSSGERYERAEFEQVLGRDWPYGFTAYLVRLFAGDTVVEQLFFLTPEGPPALNYVKSGFATEIAPTTEDGQPLASEYQYFDGALNLQAAHPWVMSDSIPFGRLIPEGPGVPPTTDGGQRNDWDRISLMADPAWVGTSCQSGPQPGDAEAHAEALAESIRSDPGLEATSPVAVSVGGYEGLMMDVRIAAGADLCWNVTAGGDPSDDPGILYLLVDMNSARVEGGSRARGYASGDWLRLYLVDVPATSGMQRLAIAIVAPEAEFERAAAAAVPLVESIEVRS